MAKKVAVIGDTTSVVGFRPLGFTVHGLTDPAEACDLWPELVSGEYAVVLVTEPVWEALGELTAEVAERAVPAVTVIPGVGGRGGVGQKKLDRAIERALGTTALIREEDE